MCQRDRPHLNVEIVQLSPVEHELILRATATGIDAPAGSKSRNIEDANEAAAGLGTLDELDAARERHFSGAADQIDAVTPRQWHRARRPWSFSRSRFRGDSAAECLAAIRPRAGNRNFERWSLEAQHADPGADETARVGGDVGRG